MSEEIKRERKQQWRESNIRRISYDVEF